LSSRDCVFLLFLFFFEEEEEEEVEEEEVSGQERTDHGGDICHFRKENQSLTQ